MGIRAVAVAPRIRVALLFVLLLPCAAAASETELRLVVYTPSTLKEFSLHPRDGRVEEIASVSREKGQKWPARYSEAVFSRNKWLPRRDTLPPMGVESANWVDYAPGCQAALVQFLDHKGGATRPPEYGLAQPWRSAGKLESEGSPRIRDAAWSADARYLVVIEDHERMSLAPRSLLLGLAGHPVPLNTHVAVIVDTHEGSERRVRLAEEVPYGAASFMAPLNECGSRRPPRRPPCEVKEPLASAAEAVEAAKKCLAR